MATPHRDPDAEPAAQPRRRRHPRSLVADDIRAAFADDHTPPPPPWIRAELTDSFYRTLEAPLQRLAADPTDEALIERSLDARHLNPRAQRWFWRTLLLTALSAPWERPLDDQTRSLLHAATYRLRPNPCAIRAGRTDYDDAQNLRQRLDPAQRRAIGRFLGLVLDSADARPTPMAALASQAIAWCWIDDAPTLAAATAMRERGRSYLRSEAGDSTSESLARAIERAFAQTPAPTGAWMSGTSEEPSKYEIELAGVQWQRLAPWLLDLNATAFCFMDDPAFRYLLPAAMCHELVHGSEVPLDFHLVTTLLEPSSYREQTRARVLCFTDQERAVIADFLDLQYGLGADSEADDVRQAIRELWDPSTGLRRPDEGSAP